MAGFQDRHCKLKRQKLSLKSKRAPNIKASTGAETRGLFSSTDDRASKPVVIDLTENEATSPGDIRTWDTNDVLNADEDEHFSVHLVDPELQDLRRNVRDISRSLYQNLLGNKDWRQLDPFPSPESKADNLRTEITSSLPVATDTITLAGHTFPWTPFPKPCISCLRRNPSRPNDKVREDEPASDSKDYSFGSIVSLSAVNSHNNRTKFTSSASDSLIQRNTSENWTGMTVDKGAGTLKRKTTLSTSENQDQFRNGLASDPSQAQKRPLFKKARPDSRSSSKQGSVNIEHRNEITAGENCAVEAFEAPGCSTNRRPIDSVGGHSEVKRKPSAQSANSTSPGFYALEKCPLCQTIFLQSMLQEEKDGHIAACYQASAQDCTW